ncbi:uncharacterized protein HKW66_Vig0177300 [Vigna angularis]|uniref:Wall-associated receptor kinase galacturonan-binding domain-containing protein n=1 Tax=Phaseolus angularis TaxID=3914 RepID=A0A8T0JY60_PHAAN|nr:uncharacterized protein HKW66_Vig0177300 [Vigna angularis]
MSVLPCCSRCAQLVVLSMATILLLFYQTCCAKHGTSCPSSSCGEIRHIKHPFRLKDDPPSCGLPEYEFDCVNNRTLVTLFSGKYYVEEINYDRYRIRLIDPGVVEDTSCSFPRYFLYTQSFSAPDKDLLITLSGEEYGYKVVFLNCSYRVSDDPRYVKVKSGGGCDFGGYTYAVLDRGDPEFTVMDVKAGCRLKVATFLNWTHGSQTHDRNVSYTDILKSLEEGFWLTWLPVACREQCGKGMDCDFNQTTQQIQCLGCEIFIHHGVSNCGEEMKTYDVEETLEEGTKPAVQRGRLCRRRAVGVEHEGQCSDGRFRGGAAMVVQGRCSRQASAMETTTWIRQAKHQRAMEATTMVRETKMKGSDE